MARTGRPKVTLFETQCATCSAITYKYPSVAAKNTTGRFFCSRECADKVGCKPRRGEHVPCLVCATPIYLNTTDKKLGKKYCSYDCHNAAQTKDKTVKACVECGNEMQLRPSEAVRQFCGNACAIKGRTIRAIDRLYDGRRILKTAQGYLEVYYPEHPNANSGKRVFEHRLVMEKVIGRYLSKTEQVDHINGVKDDNRPENLQILSASDHGRKSNVEQKAKLETALLEELQEYRRRFGAIE